MKLTVYNRDGAEAGRSIELDDAVFGIEPNDHAIWLDVRSIQAAGRQGTHKTKERGEVAKSRRKLYRQKGTGNARAGDAKSPLRKGGGTIFGPKPHKYNVGVNKKTKQLARRSVLAHKLNESALRIVEDLKLDAPKTREVAGMIASNGVTAGRTLILTNGQDDTFYRSARNLKKVVVKPADQASTLDLLNAKTVFLQEGAVEALTEALRPAAKASAETAPPASDAPKAAPAKAAPVEATPKAAPAKAATTETPDSADAAPEADTDTEA